MSIPVVAITNHRFKQWLESQHPGSRHAYYFIGTLDGLKGREFNSPLVVVNPHELPENRKAELTKYFGILNITREYVNPSNERD